MPFGPRICLSFRKSETLHFHYAQSSGIYMISLLSYLESPCLSTGLSPFGQCHLVVGLFLALFCHFYIKIKFSTTLYSLLWVVKLLKKGT